MQFIDRIQEIRTLEEQYKSSGSSLVVVYGRRRVGKTTLLSEFAKNKPSIYFLATQESETANRNAFREKVAEFTSNEILKAASVDNWDVLFKEITNHPSEDKKLIILDEFQYLGKGNPAFPSVFQRIWDECLKNANVMVVLCGSLISMMVSQALSYNSPLYGRRTAQIRLQQIPFSFYRDFFKEMPLAQLVMRYAVTGGVPKYIESFRDNDDIYEGILKNVLNPSSYLYEEPHFLLQQEVSEIGSYFSLLKAIAAGNRKLANISSTLEVKASDLTRPLKTLMDLDLVEREVPITESSPEKSKKGLYRIKDNYILFWFTFVYPYLGELERGDYGYALEKIRMGFVKNHVAFVFEDICRELLIARKELPCHFTKIGRYWDNHTEIDLVAINEEKRIILFGECKYWVNPIGPDVLIDLEKKSSSVSWHSSDRKEYFALCSVSGFTPELEELAKQRSDLLLFSDL